MRRDVWNPVADKGQHGTKQFSRCWLRSSYHAGRPELILCYFIDSFLWPNTFVVPPDKGSLPFRSVKWLTTKQESENSWRRRTCMNKTVGFHADAYMRANFLELHGLIAWTFRFVCEEWTRAMASTRNRNAKSLNKFFLDQWVDPRIFSSDYEYPWTLLQATYTKTPGNCEEVTTNWLLE